MIYDDALDITWLQDANYASTELTDARRDTIILDTGEVDGHPLTPADFEKVASAYTGRMTWWGAMAWASALAHGGFTDWRLAVTAQPDPDCTQQVTHIPWSQGFDCRNSEFGHLYYVDFAALALTDMTGTQSVGDATFLNIQVNYLTGDTVPGLPGSGDFTFTNGWQSNSGFPFYKWAWAVRDGDVRVASAPEPSTIALLVMGLVGLLGARMRMCGGVAV